MGKYGLKHFTIPFFPPRTRKNYVTNLKYIPGHLIKKNTDTLLVHNSQGQKSRRKVGRIMKNAST